MIHLDDATVAEHLALRPTTDALDEAFRDLSQARAASTQRVRAAVGHSMASAMAAVVPSLGVSGGKLYCTYPGGFSFVVALFALDGTVLCTLDGDALTRVRTAAATALAARHLAPAGVRTAALLGTGRQSEWQARALAQELDLEELRVWGRTPDRAEAVAASVRADGIPARAVTGADEAVAGAGVVVTVTSSYESLFSGSSLPADALVCGVGSTKADRRELDGDTVKRAQLIVSDSLEGARVEAGDLVQAAAEGLIDLDDVVELGEVACGAVGRPSSGLVLFESQGIALEDVVGAALAYRSWAES
jgi:ornithine cyclodeaminase